MLQISNFMMLYNCLFFILASIYTNTCKETTIFLYTNFELKHVNMVTDFSCFEILGPNITYVKQKSFHTNCKFIMYLNLAFLAN